MKNSNSRELLGTANIKTLLPQMAVPTIVAQLITTVYNLVDTYFVSTLGTAATAAVGVNNSLERTITLIGMLIGGGACSYIARLLGSRRDQEASQVMSTSFLTGIFLSIVVTVLGLIFISPLARFLGATDDCYQYTIDYASYVLLAVPFMTGSYILNTCLRSEGRSTYSMIGMGFGGILNCFLDPLFIYALDLGVAGASMATAISKFVSFCILLYPYVRKRTVAAISIRLFKLKWEHIKQVVSIGMASFLRSVFGVISSILLNRIAGSYSTSVLAAVSVATRIMQFPFAIILGFGLGVQPVIGYNWGSKKYERVKECLRFASLVSIIGGLSMAAIIFGFAKPLISIFNSKADAEIMRYGVLTLRLECCTVVVHAWGSVVNIYHAGIGKAKKSLITSIARQGYCLLPILWIGPKLFGVYGVCGAQASADLLSLAVFVPLYISAVCNLNALIREGKKEQQAES